MMDFLYDLLLYLGLIIIGILLMIAIVSAIPYAVLLAFIDRDKPHTNEPQIKRVVRDDNGDEYEKSYSSSNHCEHAFNNRNDVSTCELIQFVLSISLIGLLVGGVMSHYYFIFQQLNNTFNNPSIQ